MEILVIRSKGSADAPSGPGRTRSGAEQLTSREQPVAHEVTQPAMDADVDAVAPSQVVAVQEVQVIHLAQAMFSKRYRD